jgi:IclR family transcriptional regulator, acetate operon repressor
VLSESPADTGGPSSIGYLGRLLDLLDVIGAADGLTLTEIAERADVPLSTAHRLTSLLLERHWVTRAETSKRYLPGRNLELIGLRAAREANRQARFEDVLRRLSLATGETVSLGLLRGYDIVLVHRHESPHPLRLVLSVGDIIPAHSTALGRNILARLDERERRAVLAYLGPDAHAFLRDRADQLKTIREEGCEIDEGGFLVGLMCVAAPIIGPAGAPTGGVSVAGPDTRFTRTDAASVIPLLHAAVDELAMEFRHGF